MESLEGKTAVVTGAASGIGLALARRFARAGMSVVMADIEVDALHKAVEDIGASGATVVGARTDVSKLESVEELRDAALARFGRINLVCNNAGVAGEVQPTFLLNMDDWQWVLGVYLWGVIHGCHAFLPHLMSHGDGHIVNTASIAGLFSLPYLGPYNVAKHGVVTLSETIRTELRDAGSPVGVTVLCPGFVNTRLMSGDRNRPASLKGRARPEGTSAAAQARLADLVQGTSGPGMQPDAVADLVHDAVLDDQLYVVPNPGGPQLVRDRHLQIEQALPLDQRG